MHIQNRIAAHVAAELANGLQKRQAFNIAHRPADLNNNDVRLAAAGDVVDAILDLVRDVGDDLHRAAEEITPPLPVDDGGIDLAGGDVVQPA